MSIYNYSVSAEYSVRYSAEYFGRNSFRSDTNPGDILQSFRVHIYDELIFLVQEKDVEGTSLAIPMHGLRGS